MARPKGIKQKRDESKYWLPEGVLLKEGQIEYNKATKLVFIDPEFGEFIATFSAVQNANKSTHPLNVQKCREKTNLDRYGGINPHCSKDVRDKFKSTMLDKYGVEHALKNKELLEKSKTTLKANYGVETPMQSEILRNRQKDILLEKYGVNNSAKAFCVSKVLPNGKNVKEYCAEKNVPSCMAYRMFEHYGPNEALRWIDSYTDKSSCLEKTFKELIPCVSRFEKVPVGVSHFRPDFIINNLYIDVDGLIYHSELHKKDKNYHFRKRKTFQNSGLRLIQFYQDEILKKPEIVKSIVNAKIGNLSNRYFARKLEIREISSKEGSDFFEKTHLMGGLVSAKHIALFHDNKIVSCISYKKKNDGVDIARFSNDLETSVIGGLSRLLTYIIKKENPKFIQSFVDLRYGNGDSLKTLGFTLVSESLGWKWTDGYNTYNRLKCMANMDGRKLTEREYADELGWFKIYDAGQAKFVKYLK